MYVFQDSLFSIIGSFLYVATGSVTINYWSNITIIYTSSSMSIGLALGSFSIITGDLDCCMM